MDYFIICCIAFVAGLGLNLKWYKAKTPLKTHNLKGKYKFAKKFDYFVINEYSDNTFKLVYYNKPYSEDFAE